MCLCFLQLFSCNWYLVNTTLWSEKMLDMISTFLYLLMFDLWPKMWSILENVSCALEKLYFSAFWWNVLKMSMRSVSSNVSFKTCVSLLIFCFDNLSIGVSGVLKSPTIIVLLSVSPFMSVFVLCIEVLLPWVHRYLQLLCLPLGMIPWSLCSVLPYLL